MTNEQYDVLSPLSLSTPSFVLFVLKIKRDNSPVDLNALDAHHLMSSPNKLINEFIT